MSGSLIMCTESVRLLPCVLYRSVTREMISRGPSMVVILLVCLLTIRSLCNYSRVVEDERHSGDNGESGGTEGSPAVQSINLFATDMFASDFSMSIGFQSTVPDYCGGRRCDT